VSYFNSGATSGVIVLAAYKPDYELFGRQLRSIQDQTIRDFDCIITVDGGVDEVAEYIDREFGDDVRFRVVGSESRLGYYLNFERGLLSVPPEAPWVALSDQDDYWYPTKIETLVPYLQSVALVSGQARVVDQSGVVLSNSTARVNVPLENLLIQNQVTGGMSLFRRSLLDTALPFPRLETLTQNHDHWLGLCAAATDGYTIVDQVVQDYVQHGNNAIGEADPKFSFTKSLRRAKSHALRFEGKASLGGILRLTSRMTFGWYGVVLREIGERTNATSTSFRIAQRALGRDGSGLKAIYVIAKGFRIGQIDFGPAATVITGLLMRRRTRSEMDKRQPS
jgi:glycosyltransferase involved in cell wall biosynthesis